MRKKLNKTKVHPMAAPTASNIIYLWLIRFVGAAYNYPKQND
jgi:hypothetical protein